MTISPTFYAQNGKSAGANVSTIGEDSRPTRVSKIRYGDRLLDLERVVVRRLILLVGR
jgi:hypothetical protein